VERKKLEDEIDDLKKDLTNEKDNVKNLKRERKEMHIELEKYKNNEEMVEKEKEIVSLNE